MAESENREFEALKRSAALLSPEDLSRLTSASVLLAAWNEARKAAPGDDQRNRADYHLGNIRKRLTQARRAGFTKADDEWLDDAWAAIHNQMWPQSELEVAHAS